ncbi:ABC transporter permease [Nocardioides sp.]|uniref:ABC transporter permease n=1 Tax=Nocardioides sp. TaxID=35761 RepID=UPI0039E3C755
MTDAQASPATRPARPAAIEEPRKVRVVDAELAPPSANQGLMEVFRRRYLLRLLVRRELRGRYEGSFLGFMWSYINPLSQFFTYWFVMGRVLGLHDSVPNFAVHIFSAMIVAHFFTETWGSGTRSLVSNKSLLRKMAMPREMFPVAAMLVSFFHVVPQVVILLAACLLMGWTPSLLAVGALALALSLSMVFGTAMALLFSTANVFFRDFGSVVSILNHFLRFGIPMLYSYSYIANTLPSWAEELYLANPVTQAVLLMQKAFWLPTLSERDTWAKDPLTGHYLFDEQGHHVLTVIMPGHLFERGLLVLLGSLLVLVFAQWVFAVTERKVPERL